jgi:hypothetical protein
VHKISNNKRASSLFLLISNLGINFKPGYDIEKSTSTYVNFRGKIPRLPETLQQQFSEGKKVLKNS